MPNPCLCTAELTAQTRWTADRLKGHQNRPTLLREGLDGSDALPDDQRFSYRRPNSHPRFNATRPAERYTARAEPLAHQNTATHTHPTHPVRRAHTDEWVFKLPFAQPSHGIGLGLGLGERWLTL